MLFHYHGQFRQHLTNFIAAYNLARGLKTPRNLAPYEAICKACTAEPSKFIGNPRHQIPGPSI